MVFSVTASAQPAAGAAEPAEVTASGVAPARLCPVSVVAAVKGVLEAMVTVLAAVAAVAAALAGRKPDDAVDVAGIAPPLPPRSRASDRGGGVGRP